MLVAARRWIALGTTQLPQQLHRRSRAVATSSMLSTAAPIDFAGPLEDPDQALELGRYHSGGSPFNADIRACTSTSPVNPTVSCEEADQGGLVIFPSLGRARETASAAMPPITTMQ